MTFAEFRNSVLLSVFPDGYSARLRTQLSGWIRDCLIELQNGCDQLQQSHVDKIPFESTIFQCGASGFQGPDRGLVSRLSVATAAVCDEIIADPIPPGQMKAMQQSWSTSPCAASKSPDGAYTYEGVDYTYPDRGDGSYFADTDTDPSVRSLDRWWTMNEGMIWTFPVIKSDEFIYLRWNGVRRAWRETTAIPTQWADEDGVVSREIQSIVEKYVAFKNLRINDGKLEASMLAEKDYKDALADYIVDRKTEVEVQKEPRYWPQA